MDALIQKGNFERCYHPVVAGLAKLRNAHGYATPIGRRCSNLDEMLQRRKTATGDQRANLDRQIAGQLADLTRLTK